MKKQVNKEIKNFIFEAEINSNQLLFGIGFGNLQPKSNYSSSQYYLAIGILWFSASIEFSHDYKSKNKTK